MVHLAPHALSMVRAITGCRLKLHSSSIGSAAVRTLRQGM